MDLIRDVKTIDSTVLLIENQAGDFKLSLRSKNKNLLPLAESFNGGGHTHSAGAYIKAKKLKDIKTDVLSYLKNNLSILNKLFLFGPYLLNSK